MRQYLLILVLVILGGGAVLADPDPAVPNAAAPIWKKWLPPIHCGPRCCPDDYCPKRLPIVQPAPRGCVDDYCPKAMPIVTPAPRGCADDYYPKKMPTLPPALVTPLQTCGPPDPGECARPRCWAAHP